MTQLISASFNDFITRRQLKERDCREGTMFVTSDDMDLQRCQYFVKIGLLEN